MTCHMTPFPLFGSALACNQRLLNSHKIETEVENGWESSIWLCPVSVWETDTVSWADKDAWGAAEGRHFTEDDRKCHKEARWCGDKITALHVGD